MWPTKQEMSHGDFPYKSLYNQSTIITTANMAKPGASTLPLSYVVEWFRLGVDNNGPCGPISSKMGGWVRLLVIRTQTANEL